MKAGRSLLWALVAMIAVGGGTGIGFAVGYTARQSSVDDLNASISSRDARLADTQKSVDAQKGQLDDLDSRVAKLTKDSQDLRQQLDQRTKENGTLQANKDNASRLEERVAALSKQLQTVTDDKLNAIRGVVDNLASDRLLVAEMRKDPPEDRAAAQTFWANVKSIAQQSNQSLATKADKINLALPAYFNWRERKYANTQEQFLSYQLTGAAGYNTAIDQFWKAFMLVLVDRIDTLSGLTQ